VIPILPALGLQVAQVAHTCHIPLLCTHRAMGGVILRILLTGQFPLRHIPLLVGAGVWAEAEGEEGEKVGGEDGGEFKHHPDYPVLSTNSIVHTSYKTTEGR
jgi:hypothetical protein